MQPAMQGRAVSKRKDTIAFILWLSCVADGKHNNNIVRARTQEPRTNYGLLVAA